MHLTILTVYTSKNPKCRKEINKLEGVLIQRERQHVTIVKPNKAGYFDYKVPLDKFLPGFCQWKVDSIIYNDKGENPDTWGYGSTLATFTDKKHTGRTSTQQRLNESCTLKMCNVISTSISSGDNENLLNTSNHSIEFNYYLMDKNDH